jgi:hypothetical protein
MLETQNTLYLYAVSKRHAEEDTADQSWCATLRHCCLFVTVDGVAQRGM